MDNDGAAAPTTRRGYHGVLERHVRPYFAGRILADIDYADVEEFIADRLSTGLSRKYVRESVSVLSQICKLAMRSKVRRDNPAAGHELKVRQRKVRQGDVLDMRQAQLLIAEIPDPYKSAVWLLVLTGMRPAELCGLRVRAVDFGRSVVHIVETLLPVHRYADEVYQPAVTGPPKTAAGDRTIPIPRWLGDDLAAMLSARTKRRGSPIDPAEPLFITSKGLPLNRDRFREHVIRPAQRRPDSPTQSARMTSATRTRRFCSRKAPARSPSRSAWDTAMSR